MRRLMWERDCGAVPVVEGPDKKVVGIVTDRDLCMASLISDAALSALPVRQAMSKDIVSCEPDQDPDAAHAAMQEHQVRRLPVVDAEGGLAGIISLNDLALEACTREATGKDPMRRQVAQTLGEIGRHREPAVI